MANVGLFNIGKHLRFQSNRRHGYSNHLFPCWTSLLYLTTGRPATGQHSTYTFLLFALVLRDIKTKFKPKLYRFQNDCNFKTPILIYIYGWWAGGYNEHAELDSQF